MVASKAKINGQLAFVILGNGKGSLRELAIWQWLAGVGGLIAFVEWMALHVPNGTHEQESGEQEVL